MGARVQALAIAALLGVPSGGGAADATAGPQVLLDVTCDSDAVKAAVTAHRDELQACYQRRLAKVPDLGSTSVLEWTVRADGTTTAPVASSLAAEYEDPELRDCVVGRIRSWAFPAPEDGAVNVTLVVGFSPRLGPAKAAAAKKDRRGSIDKAGIRKVIAGRRAEISKCYDERLALDPKLAGKVVMRWIVEEGGTVGVVDVADGTTLEDHALHECMKARIAAWRFPRPGGGGTAIITYPWIFSSRAGP